MYSRRECLGIPCVFYKYINCQNFAIKKCIVKNKFLIKYKNFFYDIINKKLKDFLKNILLSKKCSELTTDNTKGCDKKLYRKTQPRLSATQTYG